MLFIQFSVMTKTIKKSILRSTVSIGDHKDRLDRYLSFLDFDVSRSQIKLLIRSGLASIDGQTVTDPSYRVKSGEDITLKFPSIQASSLEPQKIPLDIIYEDIHLIVVNKQSGLVVHPGPGNPDGTLVNALLAHCGESLKGIGGVQRPGIVHRLDKDTSGLLVCAKNNKTHTRLVEMFQERRVERRYVALLWGKIIPLEGKLETLIGRDPRDRKKMAVVLRNGRTAVTKYAVKEYYSDVASLTACQLETGRTHQIRVHTAHAGHAVVGDPIYAKFRPKRLRDLPIEIKDAVFSLGRQALHAESLAFEHPISRKYLQFNVNLPYDMSSVIETLRKNLGVA